MKLAITYAILAVIAIVTNIIAQHISIRIYQGLFYLPLSMIIGTGVGLVTKYILDKRYIFYFTARDAVHDGQTFVLYTATGIITTGIFWGVEIAFHYQFQTDAMRYLGAVIGLTIGYVIKYHLDKKFVFPLPRNP